MVEICWNIVATWMTCEEHRCLLCHREEDIIYNDLMWSDPFEGQGIQASRWEWFEGWFVDKNRVFWAYDSILPIIIPVVSLYLVVIFLIFFGFGTCFSVSQCQRADTKIVIQSRSGPQVPKIAKWLLRCFKWPFFVVIYIQLLRQTNIFSTNPPFFWFIKTYQKQLLRQRNICSTLIRPNWSGERGGSARQFGRDITEQFLAKMLGMKMATRINRLKRNKYCTGNLMMFYHMCHTRMYMLYPQCFFRVFLQAFQSVMSIFVLRRLVQLPAWSVVNLPAVVVGILKPKSHRTDHVLGLYYVYRYVFFGITKSKMGTAEEWSEFHHSLARSQGPLLLMGWHSSLPIQFHFTWFKHI